MLGACLAGSALGATIEESYRLVPSGEKATFVAAPGVVQSWVENGSPNPGVTLAFKALPAPQRRIVKMYVYISRSAPQDDTFVYRKPVVIEGLQAKPGVEAWVLPQDGDRPPALDLSDQNIAAPTRVYVYVIEKDNNGRSYSTLVETHYAALHAGILNPR